MTQLTILGTNIRQDAEGRYCLNDCHRASGAEKAKQPANFLRLDTTKALAVEINHSSDLRSEAFAVINGGAAPGTYACKELIYAYAMWINAAFHLKVIRAFDALASGKGVHTQHTLSREQKIAEAFLILHEDHEKAKEEIAVLRPQAEALDALANLEGRHNLRSAAAQCGWSQNKFIDRLISLGWVYVNPVTGRKHAYSDRIKSGMMEVKNVEVKRTGYTEGVGQPMITQKGLARLKVILGVYRAAPSREMELH